MTARGPDGRFLSADCEKACQRECAYPGRFSECQMGTLDLIGSTPELGRVLIDWKTSRSDDATS